VVSHVHQDVAYVGNHNQDQDSAERHLGASLTAGLT
jgi:hypothetical protein